MTRGIALASIIAACRSGVSTDERIFESHGAVTDVRTATAPWSTHDFLISE